jgi:hypothetical protein
VVADAENFKYGFTRREYEKLVAKRVCNYIIIK